MPAFQQALLCVSAFIALSLTACDQKMEAQTLEHRASTTANNGTDNNGTAPAQDGSSSSAASKRSFSAYLASKGYPLREVPHDSNFIQHFYKVGPTYEYAIGVNFLESKEKRLEVGPYAIPSWTHNGIVLWFWNMETNGTPGYKEFFDDLRVVVAGYDPGKNLDSAQ